MKTTRYYSLLLSVFLLGFGMNSGAYAQETPVIIVIDAGHGGNDPGNLKGEAGMHDEKALTLSIANAVGVYLEANMQNIQVIYTRTDDTYVSLNDRVYIANIKNADYFISIHCNSNPNRNVNGTETHIHDNSSKTSRALAQEIEDQFEIRAKRKSRGVKTKHDRHMNFQLLWQTKMPTILIECGFLSNITEEEYLNSEEGQDIICSAIYRGIRNFVNKIHPHTIKPVEEIEIPIVAIDTREATEDAPLYLVQIMASTTPVALDLEQFTTLGVEVHEIVAEDGRAFKYRYFVGREKDKKEARKLAKEVKKKGFKDAFVVTFTS
jgi:N-acetylmuramoyl-L-alanine amidase